MLKRYRLVIVNTVLLLALGGSLYGKRIEMADVKKTNFISSLQIPFRDWQAKSEILLPNEQRLLDPDDQFLRSYVAPDRSGRFINLSVIAGHRKRTVHTPAYCIGGDGWETIQQQNTTLDIDGREIPISRTVTSKDGQVAVITYFFTDGEYCSSGLFRFQLHQLLKRFGTGIPLGALVRVFTPAAGDGEAAIKDAEELTDDFLAKTMPPILKSMQETKLEAQ